MTNAVNPVSAPQTAPQQVQTNSAASTLASSTFNNASSADTKKSLGNSNTPISPRIVVDPLAGVITEFLTATGTVQSQIPSAAVVAYLRAGLTASGQTKPTPETEHQQHQQQDSSQSGNSVVA